MNIKLKKMKFHKNFNSIILVVSSIFVIFIVIFFSIFFLQYVFKNRTSYNQDKIYSNEDLVLNLNQINVSNKENDNNKKLKNNRSDESSVSGKNNESSENMVNEKISYKLYDGIDTFLTIPTLNIYYAPINEGTSQRVMQNYIGHFSNTSYTDGNIGLASHNRGSGATYFEDLYKLKYGDYMLYTYKNNTKMYKVDKMVTIDSYDWSYLENTNENKLTLITCINNKPNLRLCVQAIEVN